MDQIFIPQIEVQLNLTNRIVCTSQQVRKASCLQLGFYVSGIKNRTSTFCVTPGIPIKLIISRQPPSIVVAGSFISPGPLISVLDEWGNQVMDQCPVTTKLIIPGEIKLKYNF